ncbi:MAG: antibiotic biosynthesis monooxygenase [Acidobacteria bacterium]|nr:antibiotic biosynthesis monooxygenase [Acidobacteriota bacterium]
MVLRMFTFRANKGKERGLVGFMRRRALRLLRRIPACRAAYFLRNPERKGEYVWVTLWASEAGLRAARKRKDWKEIVREEESQFFAGKPQARHYQVLLKN